VNLDFSSEVKVLPLKVRVAEQVLTSLYQEDFLFLVLKSSHLLIDLSPKPETSFFKAFEEELCFTPREGLNAI
jgi:hypothetical protein